MKSAILTDSYTWQLFHLDEDLGLYRALFPSNSKDARLSILGIILEALCLTLAILTLLCAGVTPKKEGESRLIWENALTLAPHDAIFEV